MDDRLLYAEMVELFTAFLPAEVAERFSYLLSLKSARWEKIDPWQVWAHVGSISPFAAELAQTCDELLASPEFCVHADSSVTVLRCGHDKPSLGKLVLRDAVLGDAGVLEGFISVVPGRLGLVLNHDGELCILRK